MPLGDSLTVGGYGDPVGFTDSYRFELYRLLNQPDVEFRGHINGWGTNLPPGYTGSEFSHSGVGGFTVGQTLWFAQSWLLAVRPNVIVLNIGTNGGTPDEYRALVTMIRNTLPKAQLVISTLTPLRSEIRSRQTDSSRQALNSAIAGAGGFPVTLSDIRSRLFASMTEADFVDNAHFQISGGTKFAAALAPEVAAGISSARANPCR
jgi:lysophospholipase L1-like esterase